jgi:predicted permease
VLDLFNLTLPIFAVVGLGFLAARIGMVKTEAIGAINTFVFYFAMPALVAGALARQEFSRIVDLRLLGGWLMAGLLLFALGMVFCRFYQASRGQTASVGEMALTGQAASIANVGFLALPIVAANFGDEGVLISASVLIVDLLVIIPLSITLLEAKGGGSGFQVFFRAIGKAVKNPFAIAILLGVTLSASGIGLPGATDRFASFLGAAAAPTALFALGLSLADKEVESHHLYVGSVTFLKLIMHPLVVFLVLGFMGLPATVITIAVVVAACPVAQNVFVIGAQYSVFVRRLSASILASTLLAIVTVTAVLAFFAG